MNIIEGNLRAAGDGVFLILVSRWNRHITDALLDGALAAFRAHGVDEERVEVCRVPGAWEIPQAATRLLHVTRYCGVVALGCVVRGDTRHYEHVADTCADALMQVGLHHQVPVGNGVLAVENVADAVARAGGAHGNKGAEVAEAVIEMADLYSQVQTRDEEDYEYDPLRHSLLVDNGERLP